MWFTSCLSALCLAATGALAAVSVDDSGEVKSIGLRTHSLMQPYLDSDMQSRWYDFGGDTIIRTDQYIRLTSDRPSQMGSLWSRVPLTATNWEIEVEFKIHGKHQLYGDGFAMWVTKGRNDVGPVFGNADKFEGLGLFFDTYKNNRPGVVFPYVMAMVGDGHTAYDKDTDGKATSLRAARPAESDTPAFRQSSALPTSRTSPSSWSCITSRMASGLRASRQTSRPRSHKSRTWDSPPRLVS
ncbi:hypothetical protein MCOR02_008163 [Pyricularia oryzae]|nr:hypothetical protein MCOR02_008163 [Pyricularia oryzae]